MEIKLTPLRAYLAGPEVFLENAKEIGQQKKLLCRKYGFKGVFPLDDEVETEGKSPRERVFCISAANETLIKSCYFVVANLTPFRGPSCDVGTAYEIGFAHALGKKVFAYTNVAEPFMARTAKALGGKAIRSRDGRLRDCNGMFIEENELTDNLMLDGCIHGSSSCLIVEEAPPDQLFTYLGGFEKCLRNAKKIVK